jgi:hypothetical protein
MNEIFGPLICGVSCIVIAFIAVIGVVVLIWVNSKRGKEKALINPNWSSVTGQIISAELDVDDEAIISPVISFEYTIDDQVYTASQVVGRPSNLKSKALKTLTLYPLESDVVVYYNPEKPEEARLIKR